MEGGRWITATARLLAAGCGAASCMIGFNRIVRANR
jgi:hypothetical protein